MGTQSVDSYRQKLMEPFYLDILLNCMDPHCTANDVVLLQVGSLELRPNGTIA